MTLSLSLLRGAFQDFLLLFLVSLQSRNVTTRGQQWFVIASYSLFLYMSCIIIEIPSQTRFSGYFWEDFLIFIETIIIKVFKSLFLNIFEWWLSSITSRALIYCLLLNKKTSYQKLGKFLRNLCFPKWHECLYSYNNNRIHLHSLCEIC